VKENNINDVIFINGVFSANTSWHIKMMGKIAHGAGKNPKPVKDSLKGDSLKNNVKDSLKNKGGKTPQ
jgi:hypothetical protein